MKHALSIQQPWAWLITNGYKDIENRTWKTSMRGRVFVHAGKKFDKEGYDHVKKYFPHIPMPEPKDFPMGGIVGTVLILGCVQQSTSRWFFGPWGFQLGAPENYDKMIPLKGKLHFFAVPESVIEKVRIYEHSFIEESGSLTKSIIETHINNT